MFFMMTTDPSKMKREKTQTNVDGFSLSSSTRESKYGGTFLGMIPDDTTSHFTTQQECTKLPMSWQQGEVVPSGKQENTLTQADDGGTVFCRRGRGGRGDLVRY